MQSLSFGMRPMCRSAAAKRPLVAPIAPGPTGHVQPDFAVTFRWIRRSRSAGFGGHVPLESAVTFRRIRRSRSRGARNDETELAVIAQLKMWAAERVGITEMANRLNAAGISPPQSPRWTKSVIYNLRLRLSHIQPRPINERPHTDEELKQRMVELRKRGHTQAQIAAILNELGFLPLKGRRFTESSVRKLMVRCVETQLLTPRRFLEAMLERMRQEHESAGRNEPFVRPGYPRLAKVLMEAGYCTPKGRGRWWPAQVQWLLEGRFDRYYSARSQASL